jgi:hypothetical protein
MASTRHFPVNPLLEDCPQEDMDRDERLLTALTVAVALLADRLQIKNLNDALEDVFLDWARERENELIQRG